MELSFRRDRASGAYRVTGRFRAAASPKAAWAVITDYGGIASFVPSIRSSRVLSREPHGALIEQVLVGRYLFFSRSLKLTLKVAELPPDRVEFRQVGSSPFDEYAGSWTISGSTADCAVAYRLTVKPNPGSIPDFVVRSALRKDARQLLKQVRAEIERRFPGAPPPE